MTVKTVILKQQLEMKKRYGSDVHVMECRWNCRYGTYAHVLECRWNGHGTDVQVVECEIGYISSMKLVFYYLQYVPASKPFYHSWFEVLEAKTLYCT